MDRTPTQHLQAIDGGAALPAVSGRGLPHAAIREVPYYAPQGRECAIFEQAFHARLPLLLKGPTGCGKTRLVEHMAARLGRPLITVSGHDDLGAADLTGRHLIVGGNTY